MPQLRLRCAWWGGNPYHQPVFVLTHHERETLPVEGDAPFHFVTTGIESAWSRRAPWPATVT